MSVKLWTSELQKCYIWVDEQGWQPWANTFMYLPMKTDFNDATWNNTITNTWATITTLDWISCWYFNSNRLTCSESPIWTTDYTISVWIKANGTWNWWIIWSNHNAIYSWDVFILNYNSSKFSYEWYRNYDGTSVIASTMPTANIRQHICYANRKIYLNWTDVTSTVWSWTMLPWYPYTIWQKHNGGDAYLWYMSELIVETVWWTAQEISDYYNQTKSLYWL